MKHTTQLSWTLQMLEAKGLRLRQNIFFYIFAPQIKMVLHFKWQKQHIFYAGAGSNIQCCIKTFKKLLAQEIKKLTITVKMIYLFYRHLRGSTRCCARSCCVTRCVWGWARTTGKGWRRRSGNRSSPCWTTRHSSRSRWVSTERGGVGFRGLFYVKVKYVQYILTNSLS